MKTRRAWFVSRKSVVQTPDSRGCIPAPALLEPRGDLSKSCPLPALQVAERRLSFPVTFRDHSHGLHEAREMDHDKAPPRRVLRAEATLLRIPIFALAVKGAATLDGFEYRHVRARGERAVDVVIRTERDAATSYPGPLSRRVHMAILSLVAESGFPFTQPVTWTWRALCNRMGLPNSGRRDGELKAALRATWGLKIFGLAAVDGRTRESWRRLYAECEFLNETRADGSRAEANRLWFAPWYLDSLNALHSAPVDYELWKRLEKIGPLASRLYEYLLPVFYKRDALELAYDRLATAMPVVAESRRSHAIRQFAAAIAALQAEGVIADAGWDSMKGTNRPKLVLTRGPLLGARPADAESKAAPTSAPADSAPADEDPNAPARLAEEFYRLLGKDFRPLRSDLAVARGLIVRFGLAEASDRLPDAVRRLKLRFRNAETMGALVRYFEESVRDAEEARRDVARHAREAAERRREHDLDARRRAAWLAMPDDERRARREAVLAEHPTLHRFPALVEAACLHRVPLDDPAENQNPTPRN